MTDRNSHHQVQVVAMPAPEFQALAQGTWIYISSDTSNLEEIIKGLWTFTERQLIEYILLKGILS